MFLSIQMQMLLLQSSEESTLSEEKFNGNIDRVNEDASRIIDYIYIIFFGAIGFHVSVLKYLYLSIISILHRIPVGVCEIA